MTKTNQKKLGNKGFSLVELIVVIAIMAVLIGVLAPQFIKYVEKSRVNTDVQNMEEIKTAIQTYAAENGYPASAETFTISAGTVKQDVNQTSNKTMYDALVDAGISTTVNLKSSKWQTITVVVGTDKVTVTGSNSNGTSLSDGASPTGTPTGTPAAE